MLSFKDSNGLETDYLRICVCCPSMFVICFLVVVTIFPNTFPNFPDSKKIPIHCNYTAMCQVVSTSWKMFPFAASLTVMQVLVPQRQRWVKHQQFVWKKKVYLFRFSSRISTPLLLLMLLSSDLMDSSAAFTSAATDLSQLFSKLQRNPPPKKLIYKKRG